jgi:hypothetical protein
MKNTLKTSRKNTEMRVKALFEFKTMANVGKRHFATLKSGKIVEINPKTGNVIK